MHFKTLKKNSLSAQKEVVVVVLAKLLVWTTTADFRDKYLGCQLSQFIILWSMWSCAVILQV